jgi:3-dehydroquinate dehydratase-2
MKIMIINGPNLNMLGIREPEIYGSRTYEDLVEYIRSERGAGNELAFVQSNHEGDIIDAIQRAYFEDFDGIVLNPGGYTHTSIAIMDAIKAVDTPCVEVHISAIDEREAYRQISYVSEVAAATIAGRGFDGYIDAIDLIMKK